jgi:hypothetical protein
MTTTSVPILTRAQVDALALELDEIQARQAADKDRADAIKATLGAALPFGSLSAAGGTLKLSIQHNRRRNDARFMAAYPFEKYPELYKPALDTTAIKHEIAPAELEEYSDELAPKVIISHFEAGA